MTGLPGDLSLEPYAKKYTDFLSDGGASIQQHSIQAPAEAMLLFLNEVQAGDGAADLLNDFTYFRLYFDGVGRPGTSNTVKIKTEISKVI